MAPSSQFTPGGQHNNVDLRYGFPLGGASVDIVAATDRNNKLRFHIYTIFHLDAAAHAGRHHSVSSEGVTGFAMYHSRATGRFYGFVTADKSTLSNIEQWEFIDTGAGPSAAS